MLEVCEFSRMLKILYCIIKLLYYSVVTRPYIDLDMKMAYCKNIKLEGCMQCFGHINTTMLQEKHVMFSPHKDNETTMLTDNGLVFAKGGPDIP